MKVNRQMGILTLLVQKGKMTAPELAQRFEVSRRTIQRDVEDLCIAGIPVVTTQGGDGGISVAEGFNLDSGLLKPEELRHVLTGLKGLGSVSESSKINSLIQKLSLKDDALPLKDDMVIDLASHYKTSLSQKIELIRKGISENRRIAFDYYSQNGKSNRKTEPCLITFKWSAWYVLGFCCESQDFRLFKLNRLWNAQLLDEVFVPKTVPDEKLDDPFSDESKVTLLFDPDVEYLLVEAYGPHSYEIQEDGRLKATLGYTNSEYIFSWILGFGSRVQILSPPDLAEKHKETARKILAGYEHDNQLSGLV